MDALRKLFGDKNAPDLEELLRCQSPEQLLKEVKKMRKTKLAETLRNLGLDDAGKTAELQKRLMGFLEEKSRLLHQDSSLDSKQDMVEQVQVEKTVGSSGLEMVGQQRVAPGQKRAVTQDSNETGGTRSTSSRAAKRKKWRLTDPAEIAPHYYHEDLFRANFPLVTICKVGEGTPMPVKDKFEGLSLDRRQTRVARLLWSDRLMDVDRSYFPPSNEKQAFPHHMAYIEGMTQFTTPSPKVIQKVEGLRKRKREDAGGEQDYPELLPKEEESEEQLVGFSIKIAAEDIEGVLGRGRDSNNEGGRILPEGSADLTAALEEHEDIPTGFADAVLFVHDKRPLLRASKIQRVDNVIDTERAAAILERKFAEDSSKFAAPFQGAYYAVKYTMANIQKGHGTPVYVIIMTARLWSYGILVPEGFVQVRDGEIDSQSVAAFVQHQEITGVAEKNDLASLQKKLAEGTKFYQRNFRENPQARYRDGPMLVGSFYLRNEWFPLPSTEHGGFGTDGAGRLFDGLARLILGDYVLQMKAGDFLERVQVNQKIKTELQSDLW